MDPTPNDRPALDRPSTAGSFAVDDDELDTEWESATDPDSGDESEGVVSLGGVPPPPPPPTIDPATLRAVTKLEWTGEDGQAAEFYIVGTAHVSRDSCDDVAAAVRALRPQV